MRCLWCEIWDVTLNSISHVKMLLRIEGVAGFTVRDGSMVCNTGRGVYYGTLLQGGTGVLLVGMAHLYGKGLIVVTDTGVFV